MDGTGRDMAFEPQLAQAQAARSNPSGSVDPGAAESGAARTVFLQGPDWLQREVQTVLAPLRVAFHFFDNPTALLRALEKATPDAVVVDFFMDRTVFARLRALMAEPCRAHVQTVLVVPKQETPAYLNRAASIPGACLVADGERFVPRIVESVAQAARVTFRRHPRRVVRLTGSLTPPALSLAGQPSTRVRIEELSKSGARVVGEICPEVGSECELRLDMPDRPVAVRAEVVRSFLDSAGLWHHALCFVSLPEEDLIGLRAFMEALPPLGEEPSREPPPGPTAGEAGETVRVAPRVSVPAQLRVKARVNPVGGKARMYFTVGDLSDSGFRGIGPYDPPLHAGLAHRLSVHHPQPFCPHGLATTPSRCARARSAGHGHSQAQASSRPPPSTAFPVARRRVPS